MKKVIILLSVVFLFSCTQEEVITEFQEQVKLSEVIPPQTPKSPTFKLYKESYLNQRSGISFWWYDSNGFKTNVEESGGFFSGGQAYHDVNNDGFMDILVTHHINGNTSNVVWYINDGKNTSFKKSTSFINGNTNGLSSHKILKTDVNNDGLADFILLGVDESEPGNFGGNFTILIQLTNRTFNLIRIDDGKGLWYHNGAAGDLNNDGNVDVVAAEYIWWGDGKGNFTNSNIHIGLYANDVLSYEIIDINKDGFNDLILGTAPIRSPTTIVLNNNGKFDTTNKKILLPTDKNSGIHDIEIYDIDSDGDLDIVELRIDANSTRTKLHTYINTNLNFQLVPNYIQNSEDGDFLNGNFDKNGWTTFKFDDIDNDGIDDIIAENFQDGNYNGLKKINGVWKKHLFRFGN